MGERKEKVGVAYIMLNHHHSGIQETCLLLSTFAHTELPLMTTREELVEFDTFLAENDWDIYYWATGSRPLPEPWKDSEMVQRLLKHAENRGKVVLQMPELE